MLAAKRLLERRRMAGWHIDGLAGHHHTRTSDEQEIRPEAVVRSHELVPEGEV
jgi:hypothetical protein